MNKYALSLLFLFHFMIVASQQTDDRSTSVVLVEDEHVCITLQHYFEADIGDPDWLKIEFRNKTNEDIKILRSSYSINTVKKSENGELIGHLGTYGRGNQYDLMHYYYDKSNASNYRNELKLEPNDTVYAWKYLTNYASVLLNSRRSDSKNKCALFQFDFTYDVHDQDYKLSSENKLFCFIWNKMESVSIQKLYDRLKDVILHPHERGVNTYVTQHLMKNTELVNRVPSSLLIQGVLLREVKTNSSETKPFLAELKSREVGVIDSITNSYKRRLSKKYAALGSELIYYWENRLLDDVLNSDLKLSEVIELLDMNAQEWSSSRENRKKVYNYFINAYDFAPENKEIHDLKHWVSAVKVLAISRDSSFIRYLEPFLEDETKCKLEDWSNYRRSGVRRKTMKPDTIQTRICDIAFIALLRACNQIDINPINNRPNTSYKIHTDILSAQEVKAIYRRFVLPSFRLQYYEKAIQMTPDMKLRMKKYISDYF